MNTPTVGRTVHYQAFGTPGGEYKSLPRAAIVTATHSEDPSLPEDGSIVSLMIVNPTGVFFNTRVPFSKTPTPGHWNWPPRAQ